MDKAVLIAINNQCAEVQTRIAQTYETPEGSEIIHELIKLYNLLVRLLDTKT